SALFFPPLSCNMYCYFDSRKCNDKTCILMMFEVTLNREIHFITENQERGRHFIMKKILILCTMLLMVGCSNIKVLDPKSVTGKEQAYLIWLSIALMSIVIIVVFTLFTWFVIKYRHTTARKGTLPIDVKGNTKLELTYTIIPVFILLILADRKSVV